MPFLGGPIPPLPTRMRLDPRKVKLGDQLFHDVNLSIDGTISCASCHDLRKGGADGRAVSEGVAGQLGTLNSPTVLNCGFNFRQFWDGRAATLEEQVALPLHDPREMGSTWQHVLAFLARTPVYTQAFAALYPEGATPQSVADAIGTYERSLITPNSRFDQYLRGRLDALDAREIHGYELFISVGCVTCHQGVNLGGNMFQKLGKTYDFFADRGAPQPRDLGRFNVTGLEADKHLFKVPTLRNVHLTAPYLHDGSVHSLPQVIRLMAHFELGTTLQDSEVDAMAAFLETLTGDRPVAGR